VPDRIEALDYRGKGWPGMFRAAERSGGVHELTYEESWSRLTKYRPLRCNLCPDGLGRLSDIACGDAWHRYQDDGDPGRSIIIVRTEKGRRLLAAAHAAGYVHLERSSAQVVIVAQKSLLQRRKELFGRLVALRMLGIPVPRFRGFELRSAWLQQPLGVQIKTLAGTLRRALQRRWWKRKNEPSY
jgi:coenzyme F420 hydrogenase subunit beta